MYPVCISRRSRWPRLPFGIGAALQRSRVPLWAGSHHTDKPRRRPCSTGMEEFDRGYFIAFHSLVVNKAKYEKPPLNLTLSRTRTCDCATSARRRGSTPPRSPSTKTRRSPWCRASAAPPSRRTRRHLQSSPSSQQGNQSTSVSYEVARNSHLKYSAKLKFCLSLMIRKKEIDGVNPWHRGERLGFCQRCLQGARVGGG